MNLFLRFMLVLIVVGCSVLAQAEVMGAVGTNVNYQLAANGRSYEASQPLSFRGGYRFRWADVYGEYSYVNASSGSDMVTIGLANYEFLAWVRKFDPTAHNFKPFVALGLGAHYQVVTTKFAQESARDPGVMEVVGAAAAGLQIRVMKNIELTFEGRATAAEAYSPSPLLGLGGYFNLLF